MPRLLDGMWSTLILTGLSGIFGMALGLIVVFARISQNRLVSGAAATYITVIRGTPLLLQILFIFFALPTLVGIRLDAWPAGVMALSCNAAAYLAEIFRAGIQSIDKGQMEAARTLGMTYGLAMRRIILPQTVKRLIPPVVNELAALAKDTSLVSVIALSELLYVTQRLGAKYLRPWEVYVWAGTGYLLIVVALSTFAHSLETRLARKD